MRLSKIILAFAILAAPLLAVSPAHAQNPNQGPDATAFRHHQGFMIGFGLGVSVASCDGCQDETSVGLDFNVGGFINPRLAIMYDVAAWVDSEDDATLILAANTVAAQYWVAPAVWIKGGIGISQVELSYDGEEIASDNGIALTAAAGYEVMSRGKFAIDLSGRLSLLDFDGGSVKLLNIAAGFRWK